MAKSNRPTITAQVHELSHHLPNANLNLSFSLGDSSRWSFLARQVVQRLEVWAQHTKARAARIILSCVPERVSPSETFTSDTLPVCLGISDRRRRKAEASTSDWPSRLGYPDPGTRLDSINSVSCFLEVVTESVEALFDADALPVGVTVCQVSEE